MDDGGVEGVVSALLGLKICSIGRRVDGQTWLQAKYTDKGKLTRQLNRQKPDDKKPHRFFSLSASLQP
jgi:hypothetical protein